MALSLTASDFAADLTPLIPDFSTATYASTGNFATNSPYKTEYDNSYYLMQTGAKAAHGIWSGSSTSIVAVIDTAFNLENPDVYNSLWINPGEVPATIKANITDIDGNGIVTFRDLNHPSNSSAVASLNLDKNNDGKITPIDVVPATPNGPSAFVDGQDNDDNGNGKIDDLIGWDFYRTGEPVPSEDHRVDGTGSHGSNVIGILAGSANASGIVGTAPRVLVIPIRISVGAGNHAKQWGDAIDYVISLRDRLEFTHPSLKIAVVSSSLQNHAEYLHEFDPSPTTPGTYNYADAKVRSLVDKNIAYVDSAGNEGIDLVVAETNFTGNKYGYHIGAAPDTAGRYIERNLTSAGALVVGATNKPTANAASQFSLPQLASFSNYGLPNELDIRNLPEQDPASLVLESQYTRGVDIVAPGQAILTASGAVDEGTSLAAPQVAATIAIIRSLFPAMNVSSYRGAADTHQSREVASGGDMCNLPSGLGIIEVILCVSQQETQALEAQNTGYHLLDKIQYGFLFVDKSIRFLQRHGDMNLDGIVNGADIDFMYDGYQYFAAQAVYGGWFDTDQNRVNDHTPVIQNGQLIDYDGDVQHTIRVLMEIEFGDVNGDGVFNSADLTLVFLAGEYNDGQTGNSGWVEGDWNGDDEFNQADLDFAYILGPYQS